MANQHSSVSNHGDSSMKTSSTDASKSHARSGSRTNLRLSYPISPSRSPITQILNPETPTASPSSSPVPEPDNQDILTSVSETLKRTKTIAGALNVYTTKMRADLYAERVPPIAIDEIRHAERYQSVLRMKARRMEQVRDTLDRYLAEHGVTDFDVHWDERSQHIWALELEYVKKARKYLIDCHVFYKINYALAP